MDDGRWLSLELLEWSVGSQAQVDESTLGWLMRQSS